MDISSKILGIGTSNINGIEVKVPSSYEGILPINNKDQFSFEQYTFLALKNAVKQGYLVFDVGSSYGVMSVLMANLVGKNGKVVSFEANPEVAKKSLELIAKNDFSDVIDVQNFLVCESSDKDREFYAVPSFHSVASTLNPSIKKVHPTSKKIKISTIKIDDFCKRNDLFPQCLKIDVEGAEFIAIEGMKDLLKTKFPDIVLETHGSEIEGIGGSLEKLLEKLSSYGYRFFDLMEGEAIDYKKYLKLYNNKNATVFASIKLKEPRFCEELKSNTKKEIEVYAEEMKKKNDVNKIKKFIEENKYDEVEMLLRQLPLNDSDADMQYYLALSLHILQKNDEEALARYTKSLENGFSSFWIYYNRGSLFLKMGEYEKCRKDIVAARKIKPKHPGIKEVFNQLSRLDNQKQKK